MSTFGNYDPGRITVVFNAVLVQGYADGAFVKAERNNDTYSVSVGAGGDVTRVRSRDKTGQVTLTLQAESPTNDLLSALFEADEEFGISYGSLLIKDLNGTTLCVAEHAWIMKPAPIEYSNDAGTREWVIECADLKIFAGGTAV